MNEMRTLAARLQAWAPEANLSEIGEIIKSAVADYKASPANRRLEFAQTRAAALRKFGTGEDRAKIVSDLETIARADGTVSPAEQAFIDELKATLSAS